MLIHCQIGWRLAHKGWNLNLLQEAKGQGWNRAILYQRTLTRLARLLRHPSQFSPEREPVKLFETMQLLLRCHHHSTFDDFSKRVYHRPSAFGQVIQTCSASFSVWGNQEGLAVEAIGCLEGSSWDGSSPHLRLLWSVLPALPGTFRQGAATVT